jgi:hypothetical protein
MSLATEKHYKVAQVAKMWGSSPNTVRNLFAHQPGVIHVNARGVTGRRTLLIPESVLERVHQQLECPAGVDLQRPRVTLLRPKVRITGIWRRKMPG